MGMGQSSRHRRCSRVLTGKVFMILSISAGSAAVLSGCIAEQCTERGCTSGVSASLSEDPLPEQPKRLRSCLNEQCIEMEWSQPVNGCESKQQGSLMLTNCLYSEEGIQIRLDASGGLELANGDIYQLTVLDASSQVIFQEKRQVKYQDRYPNGQDCSGHCRTAAFAF